MRKAEYLRHVVSAEGVSVDPSKIECIKNWGKPKRLKGGITPLVSQPPADQNAAIRAVPKVRGKRTCFRGRNPARTISQTERME